MTPVRFSAPWGSTLKKTTCIFLFIHILFAATGFWIGGALRGFPLALVLVIDVIAAALAVRGYDLDEKELIIRRVGWVTRLAISELKSVDGDSGALNAPWRLLGCNGLFSYVGLHWNSKWRLLRVRATDPSRAVILTFAKRRYLITPHDPQQFIMRARTILKTKDSPV